MFLRHLRTAALALVAAVGSASVTPVTISAQTPSLTVLESGFAVTQLGVGFGASAVECSPGGVWGDYVYISETGDNAIKRIDFLDNVLPFASSALPELAYPAGMAFGPGPANDFGTHLYVASTGSARISRVDPTGAASLFVLFSAYDLAFDPSGTYGTNMHVAQLYGPISTVPPIGAVTSFASLASLYLRFGPGGAWGTDLYATSNQGGPGIGIVTVATDGTVTLFSGGFEAPEQFDWAPGSGFGGDMFAADGGANEVWRVKSDGTRTLFATGGQPSGIAFCNGCLYVTSAVGPYWKVCSSSVTAVPVRESSWGAIKAKYR